MGAAAPAPAQPRPDRHADRRGRRRPPGRLGIGQFGTGALSDRVGRRPLLSTGFALQTVSLLGLLPDAGFAAALAASAGLGAGTALVYPTLLAAITDLVGPADRPAALGVYRLWRDLGDVAGALVAGLVSDLLGARPAIVVVAALTAAAGLRLHAALRVRPVEPTPGRVWEDRAPRCGCSSSTTTRTLEGPCSSTTTRSRPP